MVLEEDPPKPAPVTQRRKLIALEVCVLSSMHLTTVLRPYLEPKAPRYHPEILGDSVLSTVGAVAATAIYFFVVARSGDKISDFGWRKGTFKSNLSVLLIAALGSYLLDGRGLFQIPHNLLHRHNSLGPLVPLWIMLIHYPITSAYEEFAFRGYLITRLKELTGTPWLSVPAAACILAAGHSYQGSGGVENAFEFGLLMGILFWKGKTLWPLIVVHAGIDILIVLSNQQYYR